MCAEQIQPQFEFALIESLLLLRRLPKPVV
jgi:hypothetical protein